MPHLALYLFGSPRIRLDGVKVDMAAQKALALLAYLALTRVSHRRDTLSTLFWPDYGQANARTYLRQALYELTKTIGHGWFEVNRETIGLAEVASIQTDVHEFRRLAGAGRDEADALHQAITLYTDDFLAGFSLRDCPEFEQWQVLEAESLRRTLAEVVHDLMHRYMAQQKFAEAIEFGHRWLALDPYHEPAHRSLMQLYTWSGQQTAAVRQYEECKRLLHEALQTSPDPETQALYEAIRSKRLPPPPPASAILRPKDPQGQPPTAVVPAFLSQEIAAATPTATFVAREAELAELARAMTAARLGSGQILFVIGGAGRGKTMLVQEFARRAQQDDAELLVVTGVCNAFTGIGDPYLPFREILLALAGDVETRWAGGLISTDAARRLWQAMPHTLPLLVELAPDLLHAFVPLKALQARAATFASSEAAWFQQLRLPMDGGPRPPLEEHRLFTQFIETLKAIAVQHPLLLILEDLHWVDAASNSLLFHLSRTLSSSHILVIGTYRPNELVMPRELGQHPLVGIVGELKRQYGDIWLDLGAHTPSEGRAFVDAYLDTQPNRLGEAFRIGIFQHTGGHALFTVELLRDMHERGDLRRDHEGYWVVSEAVDWRTLPAKVEGVIEQRIGRLEPGLQASLAVASVEGELFTAEVVARVQGLPEYEVVQRMSQELDRQHRLVTVEALERVGQQRLSRYRFRHHLFQQYLYSRLTESERAYMHESVSHVLETLYADKRDLVAVQLAHHFEQAGVAQKAVDYLQLAGEQAHHLSADQEALQLLSRAVMLLDTLPATPGRVQQELALRLTLARSLVALKGLGASEVGEMYMRALELYQQVGNSHDLFTVLHGLCSNQKSYRAAHTIAEQMLHLAQSQPNLIYRVSAHHVIGNTLMLMGELDSAQAHFDRSIALYERRQHLDYLLLCGQDEGLACLANRCLNLWYLGYPDQAIEQGQEAVARAQELSHPMSLCIALHFLADVHLRRGEAQAAHQYIDALLKVAGEQEFATLQVLGNLYRGDALIQQGLVEAGITQIERVREALEVAGILFGELYSLTLLANIYGQIGQVERGLAGLNMARAAIEATTQNIWQAEVYRLQGELLLAQAKAAMDSPVGLVSEAEGSFVQAIETARSQQAKSLELRATISLCRLWQAQGKMAEARATLASLLAWFTEGFDTADLVKARTLLETLASASDVLD